MATVTIKRSGNVLSIQGVPENLQPLITGELTYVHRTTHAGMDAVYHGPVEREERELFRIVDGAILTTQGAQQLVTGVLTKRGVEVVFQDLRKVTTLEPDYQHLQSCMPELEFRLKQSEILAYLIGSNSGIIVAPTAYGKTFIMLALTALYPDANIIIASPGAALLDSTYKRMIKISNNVGRVGGGHKDPQRVTLTTMQSLMHAPIAKCDILLIDEVHRIAAPTYSRDVAKIRNAVKIFGMTATPTGRADGADLVSEVLIGPVIYNIEYEEAAKAGLVSDIKVGLVSLPRGSMPTVKDRVSGRVPRKRWAYWRNDLRNQKFASALQQVIDSKEMGEDPQTLMLTETLEHALRLHQLLPDHTVVYGTMDRQTMVKMQAKGLLPEGYKKLTPKDKTRLLSQFETGELRHVISTGCWGEGVDFVYLDVVVNTAGSPSSIINTQWSGRNSRIHDGKSHGLIIDCDDKWDMWTRGRATSRFRTYKDKGWEVYDIV